MTGWIRQRRGAWLTVSWCHVLPLLLCKRLKQPSLYAKDHPRDGYRRLAWMMVDEDIVYLSPSTVYRILDRHDLLYRWKRPEPGQGRRVPEAVYPNEVWHIDLIYLWIKGRWYFLVTILDSYSRYIVHWELSLSMRADEIAETTAQLWSEYLARSPGLSGITAPSLLLRNGEKSCAISRWKRFPSG